MIIKHSTTISRINQHPLPAGPIHVPVALEDLGAAARGAALAARVDEPAADAGAAAHADRVLLARRRLGGLVAAADARAEEEVVVGGAVVDEGALHRVAACAVVGDLGGRGCD